MAQQTIDTVGTAANTSTTDLDQLNILFGSAVGMTMVAASTTAMNAIRASATAISALVAASTTFSWVGTTWNAPGSNRLS